MGTSNQITDKRMSLRFDKVFPVIVESREFGTMNLIARNISSGGMCVEMIDPLPLGSVVEVRFIEPQSKAEVIVKSEVKHHYSFNFSIDRSPTRCKGIGLRFVEFIQKDETNQKNNLRSSRLH